MAINNKIIYLKDKSKIDELLKQVPSGLDPIIFIESSGEIYTCGTYFGSGSSGVDISVSEKDGKVSLTINGNTTTFSTVGTGLSVSKNDSGDIVFRSTALTAGDIKTDDILVWTGSTKTISHNESGVKAGMYGQTGETANASSVVVPCVTVNASGHVVSAKDVTVTIRDYVKQESPGTTNADRPLLGSASANTDTESGNVVKTNGLTYNDSTGTLVVKGGISALGGKVYIDSSGDLHVTGSIHGTLVGSATGTAIPKVHLSSDPIYGGASKSLHGHVKLQDEFTRDNGVIVPPSASSSNTDDSNEKVEAVAASPLLVYNALQEAKNYITAVAGGVVVTVGGTNDTKKELTKLNITKDFDVDDDGNMSIAWYELT